MWVVNDGAWDGDDSVPPAPVPRHEREWRHPSELGEADVTSFESRSVSKAALTVAGLAGVALSLVLGRMLIPSGNGHGTQSAASAPTTQTSRPPATLVIPSSPVPSTVDIRPDSTVAPITTTAPAPDEPSTEAAALTEPVNPDTVPRPTVATLSSPGRATGASVVAIPGAEHLGVLWDGRYAITTSGIGEPGTTRTVTLVGGDQIDAVIIAEDHGLAILELDDPVAGGGLATVWPPLAPIRSVDAEDRAVSADLTVDGDGAYVLTGPTVAPGAPVIDEQGRLAGICTLEDDGTVHLVSLVPAAALMERADQLGAWLGVSSGTEPDDAATVAEIAPGAPAETGGLLVGDVITAVDGHPISSLRDLGVLLRVMDPGTSVTLVVLRDGVERSITVTTTSRPRPAEIPGEN